MSKQYPQTWDEIDPKKNYRMMTWKQIRDNCESIEYDDDGKLSSFWLIKPRAFWFNLSMTQYLGKFVAGSTIKKSRQDSFRKKEEFQSGDLAHWNYPVFCLELNDPRIRPKRKRDGKTKPRVIKEEQRIRGTRRAIARPLRRAEGTD